MKKKLDYRKDTDKNIWEIEKKLNLVKVQRSRERKERDGDIKAHRRSTWAVLKR